MLGDSPADTFALVVDLGAPYQVQRGRPFDVTVRARNIGDLTLKRVAIALRGRDGVRVDRKDVWTDEVATIAPGQIIERTVQAIATGEGDALILASCRESRGWASAGATNRVEIRSFSASIPKSRQAQRDGPRFALRMHGRMAGKARAEDPLAVRITVENTGDVTLSNLEFVFAPAEGVRLREGAANKREVWGRLEPGASRTAKVIVHGSTAGMHLVRASVRDDKGWAGAGIASFFEVEDELPSESPAPVAPGATR